MAPPAAGKGDAKNAAASPAPAPTVVVAEVTQQTVPIYSEFVGQTAANETVEVRARAQGMLERVLFTEGAPVRKGQILFQIQKSEYQARVLAAKAALGRAEAELAESKERNAVIQAEELLARAQTNLSLAHSNHERYRPTRQGEGGHGNRPGYCSRSGRSRARLKWLRPRPL